MSKKFIDISEHNTILSLSAISQCNLSGCIMKATEGTTYIDHAIDILYDGLKGTIPIGFYHFLRVTSEPETQAETFWNKIKDKEYQIIPIIDVEVDELGYKAQSYTDRFMKEFYRLSGQTMMIYSGRCYIDEHFDVSFRNDNIWWVADYNAQTTPSILGCRVVAWQYTEDCHEYAFNNGDLDVSILIDEENFFINNTNTYTESVPTNTDSDISILQQELNKQGFRDKNGNVLIVDGIAGELTLSACPIVKSGAVGMLTQWIQHKIGVTIDGIFGEYTRQAVIVYQENMSLDGDGIVGKNTWKKLLESR
jgi:GH25 family lysozyme M1 (1,4-beta-N-acetylmuramidase)